MKSVSATLLPSKKYQIEHYAHSKEYLDKEKEDIIKNLETTREKLKKLNVIISQKSSNSNILSPEKAISIGNLPLEEYMRKEQRHKVQTIKLLNDKFLKKESEPSVVKEGSNLESLRIKHTLKQMGRLNEAKQIKLKKEEEIKAAIKEKHTKKPLNNKVRPSLIPASMFPNRYKTGELPCTIEHGGKGQFLSWACPLENLGKIKIAITFFPLRILTIISIYLF
jgi:hypothetical protein